LTEKATSADVIVLSPRTIESYYGDGNWKDVRGINLLLSALSKRAQHHTFERADPETALEFVRPSTTDLIVYFSWWPKLLRRLRKQAPGVRLHVRAVNAEAFQHWHRSKAGPAWAWERVRAAYGALRLAGRDRACRGIADTVLGISEWDNRHYWSWLPGRAPILDMPYFSPWPELRPQVRPLPWESRRPAILTMPGGSDPIGLASQQNLKWLAESFESAGLGRRWEFLLSPGYPGFDDVARARPDPPVRPYPGAFEPWDALCSVRAVAVLTPLGFGTKTTVFDAIAAGCHVLLDERLARRMPAEVRARCISLRCGEPIDTAVLAERLRTPPDAADLHAAIRLKALHGLGTALG
jgi:hypothetical protein